MKKSELKNLIKECLLEIIVEGMPQNVFENINERKNVNQRKQNIEQPAMSVRRPGLDVVYPNGSPKSPVKPQKTQNMNNFKELAGGNDVMASIFADTASSGLVESISYNDRPGSSPVVDTGIDPSMFEGSKNWEALAFSGNIRK